MKLITDLHLHSKWSRSCSKELTLPNIARACERKGIGFVGTSDALHPSWRQDIGNLLEMRDGALYLRDGSSPTAFVISTEISCIYKRHGKTRRVHHVLLFPTISALDRLIEALTNRGCNLKSDGRPIVGIDSEELLKMALDADPESLLIPAHAWTPWFAIFRISIRVRFDRRMFWRHEQPCLRNRDRSLVRPGDELETIRARSSIFLVSNSDAHSLNNLGREANVFEMEKPSYAELRRILVGTRYEKIYRDDRIFS